MVHVDVEVELVDLNEVDLVVDSDDAPQYHVEVDQRVDMRRTMFRAGMFPSQRWAGLLVDPATLATQMALSLELEPEPNGCGWN